MNKQESKAHRIFSRAYRWEGGVRQCIARCCDGRMGAGWIHTSVAVGTVTSWIAAGVSLQIASVLGVFAKKTI